MVQYKHRADRALVQLCGELTQAEAVELVDTVDLLVETYFYTLVEVLITSPGGVAPALEHYLDAQRRWRAAGVRIRTRVVESAASAAALMLSLGDERVAEPGASLLYHLFRSFPDGPVTASRAAVIFTDLNRLDERWLARLVDRVMAGPAAMVPVDVEPSDFRVLDWLTADLPTGGTPRPRRARGLARVLERAVRRAIRGKDRATLTQIYRTLCRSELAVSPAVARTLRLVDRVGAAETARARAQGAPGLTIPEWAPLYPPSGEVAREVLTRHAIALGDTGSGKTLSAVLPAVCGLIQAPAGRVAGALVIDPKAELGPVLEREAPETGARARPVARRSRPDDGPGVVPRGASRGRPLRERRDADRRAGARIRPHAAHPRARRAPGAGWGHQRRLLRP